MKLFYKVLLLAVLLPLIPAMAHAEDERAVTRKLEHRVERTQPTALDSNGYQVVPRNNTEANYFINNTDARRQLEQQIDDEQRNVSKRRNLDN